LEVWGSVGVEVLLILNLMFVVCGLCSTLC
jgi:hypothetical protein